MAGEIRAQDAQCISNIEQTGCKVLIVWESDYKQNKQRVVDRCLEFLRE